MTIEHRQAPWHRTLDNLGAATAPRSAVSSLAPPTAGH